VVDYVASLTIRGLDQDLKMRLRVRAARKGHSMEAEVRAILLEALSAPIEESSPGLGSRIHARFAGLGGPELDLPARTELPRSAEL
jgi:antitoxin FitA